MRAQISHDFTAGARVVESLATGAHPVVLPSGVDVDSYPTSRPTGKVPTVIFNTLLCDEAEIEDAMLRFARSYDPQAFHIDDAAAAWVGAGYP